MKKLISLCYAIAIAGLFISCNDDNGAEIKEIYYTKIDSVKIPMDTMSINDVQSLRMFSTFTKNCEGLYSNSYEYGRDLTRIVSNIAYKTNEACGDANYVNASLVNFKPIMTGTYNFKFWNGKDEKNENLWIEKKIVVQ